MAAIFRRLHSKNKDENWHLIFVITKGRGKRWDISSQITLNKEYWTPARKVSNRHEDAAQLNFTLDLLEHSLKAKALELLNQDLEDFQIHLILQHLVMEKKLPQNLVKYEDPKPDFFEFAQQFILEAEASKAKGTIKGYKQSVNQLYLFRNYLRFEEINLQFYYAFVVHLTRRGLINNTIGKHIKVLKTILNEATDRGYNTNLDFRKRRFKVFKEESDSVYLSLSELDQIAGTRDALTPAMRRICDMFLIGCYTGLRFSDLSGLTSTNIISDETGTYIVQRTQKTGQQVVIPLNTKVREILHVYNGKLPGAISNQKTNKALKKICAQAGIDGIVETKSKAGGDIITHQNPKYELVSTHTARRSFATNAFLSGVPVLSIMKITGHKTERAFMDYIKATQLENAMVVAKHPFFR